MAFASSSRQQASDSQTTSAAAEKKHFSLGSITSWLTKTKDAITGGSVSVENKSRVSDAVRRDNPMQTTRHKRRSPVDMLECCDKIDEEVTTFQVQII